MHPGYVSCPTRRCRRFVSGVPMRPIMLSLDHPSLRIGRVAGIVELTSLKTSDFVALIVNASTAASQHA